MEPTPRSSWCAPDGEPGPIEPGAPDLELSCYGSDPCTDAPCTEDGWRLIAEVTLPVSFLLVDDAAPVPTPTASPAPTPAPTPSPTPSAAPTAAPSPTPSDSGEVPASRDALFAFLQSRAYTGFAAESLHPTAAPHMQSVRTFLNPLLEASLESGAPSHPVGAAAIKEMYDGDGTLRGWAAMVKVSESDGSDGSAWYWYEVFNVDTGSPVIDGVGNGTCTGCHGSGGTDFVRVPFPLQ